MEIHAWWLMTKHVYLIFRSIKEQNPALLLGNLKRFTSKIIVKSIQENPRESSKEFLVDFFKKEA
jgi:REP element-mobilizing transposase RayT